MQLRLFYKVRSGCRIYEIECYQACDLQGPHDDIFLDMFEDEYESSHGKPLNVEYLMMDDSLLLPPTGTPMTGIGFDRRLPCGEVERARRVRVEYATTHSSNSFVTTGDADLLHHASLVSVIHWRSGRGVAALE